VVFGAATIATTEMAMTKTRSKTKVRPFIDDDVSFEIKTISKMMPMC